MRVQIKPSPLINKKYVAIFIKDSAIVKTTHFGSAGMSDFTKHGDVERRKRYLARHSVREDWNDMFSAGALSRWILWNNRSFSDSVEEYKKRFDLK